MAAAPIPAKFIAWSPYGRGTDWGHAAKHAARRARWEEGGAVVTISAGTATLQVWLNHTCRQTEEEEEVAEAAKQVKRRNGNL